MHCFNFFVAIVHLRVDWTTKYAIDTDLLASIDPIGRTAHFSSYSDLICMRRLRLLQELAGLLPCVSVLVSVAGVLTEAVVSIGVKSVVRGAGVMASGVASGSTGEVAGGVSFDAVISAVAPLAATYPILYSK